MVVNIFFKMAPSRAAIKFIFLLIIVITLINCQDKSHNQEKVMLGFIWENPRTENHNADEVTVDGSKQELRLTCILDPPLPVTKENFRARDSIVRWNKLHKTHGQKLNDIFWSDDQTITAISLSNIALRQLGSYACSYRSFLKIINITVSDIEEVKKLPAPLLHSDLEGAVMNMKDLTGLDNWNSFTLQQESKLGAGFPCKTQTKEKRSVPNSVHSLRPNDIDIVLSLGGANSAGVAANSSTVPGLFSSHKTVSFSIGVKFQFESMITLPAILKKFNPKLKGSVVRQEEFTMMHYGSSLRHLPSRVKGLLAKLQSRKDIDFGLSWKLLTFSLDFDDYCIACKIKNQLDERIKSVVEALDILYLKVPRLYVNLVLPPNITQLYRSEASKKCPVLYRKQCQCLESNSVEDQNDVSLFLHDLKSHITKVTAKYNGRSDFTVVIQPFWSENVMEKANLLAEDCFHLSASGQELAAVNLWNNMLQPVGSKNSRWIFNKNILCPSEARPYLYTSVNSPKDDEMDLSVNDDMSAGSSVEKSTSTLSLGLGIGLTLFIVIVVATVIVLLRRNRRTPLIARIRILAVPWRRMKEKI